MNRMHLVWKGAYMIWITMSNDRTNPFKLQNTSSFFLWSLSLISDGHYTIPIPPMGYCYNTDQYHTFVHRAHEGITHPQILLYTNIHPMTRQLQRNMGCLLCLCLRKVQCNKVAHCIVTTVWHTWHSQEFMYKVALFPTWYHLSIQAL